MGNNNFTQEDLQKLQEFGKFILDRATWQLTTTDALRLNKFLAFYNSLTIKVEANILEIKALTKLRPDEPTPESEQVSTVVRKPKAVKSKE